MEMIHLPKAVDSSCLKGLHNNVVMKAGNTSSIQDQYLLLLSLNLVLKFSLNFS